MLLGHAAPCRTILPTASAIDLRDQHQKAMRRRVDVAGEFVIRSPSDRVSSLCSKWRRNARDYPHIVAMQRSPPSNSCIDRLSEALS